MAPVKDALTLHPIGWALQGASHTVRAFERADMKTNYAFEKRQREMAKKQKKESKLAEKAARKAHGPDAPNPSDDEALAPSLASASTSPAEN